MDNYYTSPILFHNLRNAQTGATGTCKQNRLGLPKTFKTSNVKKKGDMHVFTYGNEMKVVKIYDRKPVALLSTVSTEEMTATGKRPWETGIEKEKLQVIVDYNKWMGGVDCNDQLLEYSGFNHRSLKWWGNVSFWLLNLAMCNAYILYKEGFCVIYPDKPKPKHSEFRLNVIKKMLNKAECVDVRYRSPKVTIHTRLKDRHFPEIIPTPGGKKQLRRICAVCVPAERKLHERAKLPKKKNVLELNPTYNVNSAK